MSSAPELWGPQELLLGRGKVLTPKMAKLSLSSVALRDGDYLSQARSQVCVCITIGDLICVLHVNEERRGGGGGLR